MTAADRAWLTAAACISEDPELFFPVGNTGRAALQIEQAKQVCACCPVRATCLDWAQRLGADEGSGAG